MNTIKHYVIRTKLFVDEQSSRKCQLSCTLICNVVKDKLLVNISSLILWDAAIVSSRLNIKSKFGIYPTDNEAALK